VRVKIRKGDTVEIISGNLEDKGKRGEVIKVLPDRDRIVVQGINISKSTNARYRPKVELKTGIIEFEGPIHISNVMLVCPNVMSLR
jgi:large subunit ribosomal protein L24